MKKQELKDLLTDSFEFEKELIDLVKQCFTALFPENNEILIRKFEEDIESGMEMWGCLQTLEFYHKENDECEERKKRMREND